MNISSRSSSRFLRWFTLIEVLITIVIISLLIGLIFNIFITIGRLSVHTQLQRAVHNELIYAAQTIQNMVDNQEMSLTGYDFSPSGDPLTYGRKTSLEMTDGTYIYQLDRRCTWTTTGCYLELTWSELEDNPLGGGALSGSLVLTDTAKVQVDSFLVRKLPYDDPSTYEQLLHEGFWLLLNISVPQYDDANWWTRVRQQVQFFFTMRKYE